LCVFIVQTEEGRVVAYGETKDVRNSATENDRVVAACLGSRYNADKVVKSAWFHRPLSDIVFFVSHWSDMKKSDLIEDLATAAEVTKPQARIMVDRLVELIQTGVRKEGRFPMSGLGTFAVGKRAARTGRNPATGEKLKIKATNTAKFRAAPALKAAAKKFKS
jgi:DNA-binding protein HU-beta